MLAFEMLLLLSETISEMYVVYLLFCFVFVLSMVDLVYIVNVYPNIIFTTSQWVITRFIIMSTGLTLCGFILSSIFFTCSNVGLKVTL